MDTEILRKAQLVELEIANEIKRVCEDNNIQYFLDAGTLLGAVRHKGFIPWDDDMDLAMTLDNYKKFLEIAPKKLDKKYFLETWDTDFYYPLPFAKVIKLNTIYKEKKAPKKQKNGIWVDIFPVIEVTVTSNEVISINKKMIQIQRLLMMKCGSRPWREENGIIFKKLFCYYFYKCISFVFSKKKLMQFYNNEFNKINENGNPNYENKYIFTNYATPEIHLINKEYISDFVDINFEDTTFKAPKSWDKYLTSLYGDYMTPPPPDKRENLHLVEDVKL